MLITTKPELITLKAEDIIDGMKIGIIKEKLAKNGVPVSMGFKINEQDYLEISFSQKDLIDLLCWENAK